MSTLEEIFRFENLYYENYHNPKNRIRPDSPEILLMKYICEGRHEEAVQLFEEKQQFGDTPSVVDAPNGRFTGLDGIRKFAQTWISTAQADGASIIPMVQTQSGGRSATEMLMCFEYPHAGKIVRFPVLVVGDLRGGGKLDEVRIYYFYKWVPGISPYRHRMFRPSFEKQMEPAAMTGALRAYSEALATMRSVDELPRIMDTMTDDVVYGGYRPETISGIIRGKEAVEKKYRSFVNMPQIIRFESVIDDGLTAVCEWVGVPNPNYVPEEGKIPLLQSGVGIYVRDLESGLIKEVRIIDNARFQDTIDWETADILY